jgi:hypothetical protein
MAGDPQQRPVVGVRTRPAAAGQQARITTYRIVDAWHLDRVMLQSVVQAHRPKVPVLDLGPLSSPDLG